MRLGSFREVEGALGIADSTFGDALRKRHFGFFQDLCDLILLDIRARTENRRIKKAIRQILAIDSSDIRVHGSLFKEPGWKPKNTISHNAAAKLHVIWNIDGQWIDDFTITPGRRSDSPVSFELRLLSGKIYVFDRAYNDFNFWYKIVSTGSDFVTRLKDYQRNRVLQKKILRGKKDRCGVLYDGEYVSTSVPARKTNIKYRYIIYRDRVSKKIFHFVTSDRKASAKEIADVYRKRWAIELLFRWLKGHLDIRYLPTRTQLRFSSRRLYLCSYSCSSRKLSITSMEPSGIYSETFALPLFKKSSQIAALRATVAGAALYEENLRPDILENKPVSSEKFQNLSISQATLQRGPNSKTKRSNERPIRKGFSKRCAKSCRGQCKARPRSKTFLHNSNGIPARNSSVFRYYR